MWNECILDENNNVIKSTARNFQQVFHGDFNGEYCKRSYQSIQA